MYNIGDIVLYNGVRARIRQILGDGIYLVEIISNGILRVQIAKAVELEPFAGEENYERY